MGVSWWLAEGEGEEPVGPDWIGRIWLWLLRPWLLVGVAGVALALAGSAALLPQLPGQYATDPVGASRWFLSTADQYGALGSTLRDVGLFDFMHSLTLRLLLAGLGLLTLLHVADLAQAAWNAHRLAELTSRSDAELGRPLTLPARGRLYRQRQALARTPAELHMETARWLASRYPRQEISVHALSAQLLDGEVLEQPLRERRILAQDGAWIPWLRLAGAVGLLLGLAGLWAAIHLGWTVHLALLAPGSTFRYAPQELTLTYGLPAGRPPASLHIQVGEEEASLTGMGPEAGERSLRLGSVRVASRPAAPGLLVLSSRPALARVGQDEAAQQVGLLFPSPGSEETVTLPEQEYALRLVRLPGPAAAQPTFLVELFDGSSLLSGEPVQRLELTGEEGSSLFLDRGQLQIAFLPAPGLTVTVGAAPGLWLVWPGLILAVLGAVGMGRRDSFLLAQIAPWPMDRSVLILQGDDPDAVASLAAWAGNSEQVNG